jgi:FAD/FMN-containing dehydrogenase
MDAFYRSLKQKKFEGDIDNSEATRQLYSHDASLFELVPQVVVAPKNIADLERLVQAANECRGEIPGLSLTARSGGTCMSGGSIGESVVVDFNKYFTKIENVSDKTAQVQPGVFYRDFEKETLTHTALMPSYPASRELCTVGGMVANNSGGEKSLQYGKTEDYVTQLDVVLSDGNRYVLKPLNASELEAKIAKKGFEGDIYSKLFNLLDSHYSQIKKAKPKVSKNSTGYNLWDVWDRDAGIFDLTKLFVGSQGTLGLVNDIHFRLVRKPLHSGLLILFLKDLDDLGELIPKVLEYKPATFECFDGATLLLSLKLMPYRLNLFIYFLVWPLMACSF